VEHRELVAKHKYLDVLGRVGAGEQHHPTRKLGDDEVGQSECHKPDHAVGRGGANLQVRAVDPVSGTHRFGNSVRRFELGLCRELPSAQALFLNAFKWSAEASARVQFDLSDKSRPCA